MGNRLESLPESLGGLQELRELEVTGNRLRSLPDSLGSLGAHFPCQTCLCAVCWHAVLSAVVERGKPVVMSYHGGLSEGEPAQAACRSWR